MTEETKRCTNCTRGPQPLDQFIGARGYPVSTCAKCREKGKKADARPDRQEYHTELQKARGAGYSKKSTEKKKSNPPPPEHNLEQKCEWISDEKTKERLSLWKRLNIHDRLSGIKRVAISKDIEWHLTDDEAEKMMTSPCVYCSHLDLGIRLNGIDRLNQQGHYTTENTVACCWTCNFMKGCFDPRTFIEQCKKISTCAHEFPDVPIQTNIRPRKFTGPSPTPAQEQETQTNQEPSPDPQTL
jgi:hypothetical protein